MRAAAVVVCVGLVALLAGCVVPSLHPLYTEKDLVFEEALLGLWREPPDEEAEQGEEAEEAQEPQESQEPEEAQEADNTWRFERGEDKSYRLTITEDGRPGAFEAHLVKLGNHRFLDLYPGEIGEEECPLPSAFWAHVLPAHSFWRIALEADSLHLATLDPDWLEEQVENRKLGIACETVEDYGCVLTAATKDLQQFLVKHADDADALPERVVLRREK